MGTRGINSAVLAAVLLVGTSLCAGAAAAVTVPLPSHGIDTQWLEEDYGNWNHSILDDGIRVTGSYEGLETMYGGWEFYSLVSDQTLHDSVAFSVKVTIDSVTGAYCSVGMGIIAGTGPVGHPDSDYIFWGSHISAGGPYNSIGFRYRCIDGVVDAASTDANHVSAGRLAEYGLIVSENMVHYYLDGQVKLSEAVPFSDFRVYVHAGTYVSGSSMNVSYEHVCVTEGLPQLAVLTPLDGDTFDTPVITVSGVTSPNSTLSVGGYVVSLGATGDFSIPYPLQVGENDIVLEVTDEFGFATSMTVAVTYEDRTAELIAELEELTARYVKLSKDLNASDAELAALQTKIDDLTGRLDSSLSQIHELNNSLETVNGDLSNARSDIQGLPSTVFVGAGLAAVVAISLLAMLALHFSLRKQMRVSEGKPPKGPDST